MRAGRGGGGGKAAADGARGGLACWRAGSDNAHYAAHAETVGEGEGGGAIFGGAKPGANPPPVPQVSRSKRGVLLRLVS